MKKQFSLLAMSLLLGLSFNARAADSANATAKADEGLYSASAIQKRLAPIGAVCIKGEECNIQTASTSGGAAAQPTGSGMTAEQIFDKHCANCHKTGVLGAPKFGNADSWAPHIAKGQDTLYHSAIHGFKAMPPMGTCSECSPYEIKTAVNYMVNHSGGDLSAPKKPEAAKPAPAPAAKPAPEAKKETAKKESSGSTAKPDFTVEMLNSGKLGMYTFQPAYLHIQPGDTVLFKATDKMHDSQSVFVPKGADNWKGEISQDITVTFDKEGVYIYECMPHHVMGMYGIIQVGNATNKAAAAKKIKALNSKLVMNKDRLNKIFKNVK